MPISALRPPPPRQPALRAGEIDTRYFDFTDDLSQLFPGQTTPDYIVSPGSCSLAISRRDNVPTSGADLQSVGVPMLDGTRLIATFQLYAPITATNVDYRETCTVTTAQGRTLVRDAYQLVTGELG